MPEAAAPAPEPMVLHTPFVAALPALSADELAPDVAPPPVPGPRQVQGLQAAPTTLLRRAPRPAAPVLGDAVLAVRAPRIDPRLGAPEEAGPVGVMAAPPLPPALALNVDLPPPVPEAPLARAKEATVIVDGDVRASKRGRAMQRTWPLRPEPGAPMP